jgi:hypothetical protein
MAIIRHYDDDLSADDFVFEEKRKKMNHLKEKKNVKAISLGMLPTETDQEVK